MKTKISAIILLLLFSQCSKVFSQSTYIQKISSNDTLCYQKDRLSSLSAVEISIKKQLDSTITTVNDINSTKYEYIYRNNGLGQDQIIYNWNPTSDSWTPHYKVTSLIDEKGKLRFLSTSTWNSTNNSWLLNQLERHFYDENLVSKGESYYDWIASGDSLKYNNGHKNIIQYNDSGYHIIRLGYVSDSTFVETREEFDYAKNGNLITDYVFSNSYFYPSTIFTCTSKTVYLYDSDNKQISKIVYYFNPDNSTWVANSAYRILKNNVLNIITYQSESIDRQTLKLYISQKKVDWFNSLGTIYRSSSYNFTNTGDSIENSRNEYFFNENNQDTLYVVSQWNSDYKILAGQYKYKYLYEGNNQIGNLYYRKDSVFQDWKLYGRANRVSLEGDIETFIGENYDSNTKRWVNYYKNESSVKGVLYYIKRYLWNSSDSSWVGQSWSERILDNDNYPFITKSFYWNSTSKAWIDQGTVYYYYSPVKESGIQKLILNGKVYPNPATDYLQIELSENETYKVSVFTTDGREQLNTTLLNTKSINVSGLKSGLYIFKVESNSKILMGSFIKR